ncbi:Uncharacterised protein [Chlamydia trachomatis]|nr:Uncharacterised protein [Chlamydia trachomatis]
MCCFVLFCNKRDVGGATATEEDSVNGHTLRCFPVGADDRALRCRNGEAAVRVSSLLAGLGGPVVAVPVDQVCRDLAVDAFPPHIAIVGQCDVGEDGVGAHGVHSHRVGVVRGARRNAEEAGFRVDCVQATIRARAHPRDVITDGLNGVTRDGRLEHGEVGLATC